MGADARVRRLRPIGRAVLSWKSDEVYPGATPSRPCAGSASASTRASCWLWWPLRVGQVTPLPPDGELTGPPRGLSGHPARDVSVFATDSWRRLLATTIGSSSSSFFLAEHETTLENVAVRHATDAGLAVPSGASKASAALTAAASATRADRPPKLSRGSVRVG